jgi:hypothetical protein
MRGLSAWGIAAIAAIAASCLASWAAQAAPATLDLFRAAQLNERQVKRRQEFDPPGVIRLRHLEVQPDALERVQRDAVAAYGTAAKRSDAARLRIGLFPQVTGTFRQTGVERAFGGRVVWVGAEEFGRGSATLVTFGGQVTAQIVLDGRTFRIDPISGALHQVSEISLDALPADAPHQSVPRMAGKATTADRAAALRTRTRSIVEVLVAYTARAETASANILNDVNLAVSLTNQAFSNSGVGVRIRLRGTMLAKGYDELSRSYTAALYDLTGMSGDESTSAGRAALAPVRQRRDEIGADLVVLLREGTEYCGQAWVIEQPSRSYSQYGYAQVSRVCVPRYVMAHELAHLMGLRHDRYVEDTAPASVYNYGFVHLRTLARDIMSYPNLCSDRSLDCTVVNMFSNPRKYIDGARFGIAAGRPGAADGARRLNETRSAVADYR